MKTFDKDGIQIKLGDMVMLDGMDEVAMVIEVEENSIVVEDLKGFSLWWMPGLCRVVLDEK